MPDVSGAFSALFTAIGALAAVVGYLYRSLEALRITHLQCETKLARVSERLSAIEDRLTSAEGERNVQNGEGGA